MSSSIPELGVVPGDARAIAWLHAPMPGAALCRIEESALRDLLGGPAIALSADLRAVLLGEAREGSTRLAGDRSGAPWRVRCIPDRAGAPLWLAQSVADSRSTIASLLRAALARRLAGNVLHELRNPLNALSLYADVLAMLAAKPPSTDVRDKSASTLQSMRQRLQDLNARVTGATELWIGNASASVPAPLATIWREVHKLVNGFFTLNAISFEVKGAELFEQQPQTRERRPLELVLIGLLMMAADAAITQPAGDTARSVRVQVDSAPAGALTLRLDGPLSAAAFAGALGCAVTLAAPALCLLLGEGAETVEAIAGEGLLLRLPPR